MLAKDSLLSHLLSYQKSKSWISEDDFYRPPLEQPTESPPDHTTPASQETPKAEPGLHQPFSQAPGKSGLQGTLDICVSSPGGPENKVAGQEHRNFCVVHRRQMGR